MNKKTGTELGPKATQVETLVLLPVEGPGTQIGRYRILEKIGEGGFGAVYVAEQKEPVKRRVALKIIKLGMDTRQVVARFEAERQALAMMDHPNIAKVLDAGATETGRPYFVMELVKGIPITKFCEQEKSETAERLNLFIQICHAIQHAHQKGIIHRDIKPSNILVTLHDGVPVPMVIDFGIAKATQAELTEKTVYTQLHQFIGTPAYMSPEQAEMSGLDIDTRSDIYSLGVLLYELLTGSTPFDTQELLKSSLDEMRKIIREREPMWPSTRLRQTATLRGSPSELVTRHSPLATDLDWIAMKCLEKDRRRRYETANAVAMDVERHLRHEPIVARPPSRLYQLEKLARRNKLAFTAAAIVLTALVIGLGISVWSLAKEKAARRRAVLAEQAAERARQNETALRLRAQADEEKAADSERGARRLLYDADMNLAQHAIHANNLGFARRLLDRHRPNNGEEDLRRWEWRYLWQQTQSDALATLTRRPTTRAFFVSFAPDGRRLAVAYWDRRVELWEMASRRLERVIQEEGERRGIGVVAFSPHTNLLAATAGRGKIKLLALDSGAETILCDMPSAWFGDIIFSSDGTLLAVQALTQPENTSVLTFDLTANRLVSSNAVPFRATPHARGLRISPDRQRLYVTCNAAVGQQSSVQCLRLSDGQLIWETEPTRDFIGTALDLSPDGRWLVSATGYEDPVIRVWDAATGKLQARLEGHTSWVCRLSFSPDGRWLASACSDQTIRLWDTLTWTETAVLRGNADEVHALAFSPDGQTLASGSKDGAVMLWDAHKQKTSGVHQLLSSDTIKAWLLPGSRWMAALGTNLTTLTVTDGVEERRLRLPTGETPHFYDHIPDNYLAIHDGTNRLRVCEILAAGLQTLADLPVGTNSSGWTAHCRKRKLLAWGAGTPEIAVASLDEPNKPTVLTSDLPRNWPAEFGGDGRFLFVMGTNGGRVWDLTTRAAILTPEISDKTRFACFANGGNTVVTVNVSGGESEIVFRNLLRPDEEPRRFDPHLRQPERPVASPDGAWVAIPSEDGKVVLYDAAVPTERAVLHGHVNAALGATFSPDGRRLVSSCGGSQTAILWDIITGQELLTLAGQGSVLYDVQFSEDGDTLLIGSEADYAGTYQFWRAPSWEEIEAAEAKQGQETRTP